MVFSYPFTLCRRAVVVTMDLAARNLELFTTDHWLSNPQNCRVLRLTAPVWGNQAGPAQDVTPAEQMASWTCQELRDYLTAHDMAGLATHLHKQSVNGSDFLSLTQVQLVEELHCSPFAARKLVAARTTFLERGRR